MYRYWLAMAAMAVVACSTLAQLPVNKVADPTFPLPLYHPNQYEFAPAKPDGLLSPLEVTASAGVLKVRAGIIRFDAPRLVLARTPDVFEVIASGDCVEVRWGKLRYAGHRATLHMPTGLTLEREYGGRTSLSWDGKNTFVVFH
jgi:hypothetical protein